MNKLYNARDFFKSAILKGYSNIANRSMGFINEALNKSTGYHNYNDDMDTLLSVSTISEHTLRLIFNEDYVCNDHCACLKQEIQLVTGLSHFNIQVYSAPISISHFQIKAGNWIGNIRDNAIGTLGGFMKNINNIGPDYIISNNHVLAMSNAASIGDPIRLFNDKQWWRIGTLSRYVPIYFNGVTNKLDLAIANVTNSRWVNISGYSNSRMPQIGEVVSKLGARTGETYGKVLSTDETIKVRYGNNTAVFTDQILIESYYTGISFSQPGDSGSLIYGANDDVVGLLFAGNGLNTHANPAPLVVNQLSNWLKN